jgi:hypothetical protein
MTDDLHPSATSPAEAASLAEPHRRPHPHRAAADLDLRREREERE